MATIEKRKTGYRAKIYVGRIDGKARFESITAPTRREVAAKALAREAELSGANIPHKTLSEAFTKYLAEISPAHKGHRWEKVRLTSLKSEPIARLAVSKITPDDLIAWRNERLTQVKPSSVLREMNLLQSVFEAARKEWRWIATNPLKDVSKPTQPAGRKRGVKQSEIDALIAASGYTDGPPRNQTQMSLLAFLFAIETAMRAGEILGLTWDTVKPKRVILPKTKNGDSREVPLSPKARSIIDALRGNDKPFEIHPGTRDTLFRKLVRAAGVDGLHFHDSRSEAIFRLSKKLDVLELARIIGHRDINSLRHYYNVSADELADRL